MYTAETHSLSGSMDYRILVVENDPAIARMVMNTFSQMAITADHAADKPATLQLAKKNKYHLALLDIQPKNQAGLKLIEVVKRLQPHADIITMTRDNQKEVEVGVRELRAIYHLIKPFSITELTAVIQHIIKRKRSTFS